jgi:hypothetical protein
MGSNEFMPVELLHGVRNPADDAPQPGQAQFIAAQPKAMTNEQRGHDEVHGSA